MGQNNPRASVPRRIGNDRPDRQIGEPLITVITREVNAAGRFVDMGNPQPLP